MDGNIYTADDHCGRGQDAVTLSTPKGIGVVLNELLLNEPFRVNRCK